MYVTRPLSMYRRDPESLSLPPPEGPNSGYLVVFDAESETPTCFGLCNDIMIWNLLFPQNKLLRIGDGDDSDEAIFIPVLNQPLSSNRYYAIVLRQSKHQGNAFTSSKEEDMSTGCCGGPSIKDVKPRPLDPSDAYQQVEIITQRKNRGFSAKSIASDGFPPDILRRKWWTATMETPKRYQLREAQGLDASQRARLPPLGSRAVVGRWYCPFMFVEEGSVRLKDQMKQSMFYEMALEQGWERIFECDKMGWGSESSAVLVDVVVETEEVCVAGRKAVREERGMVGERIKGEVFRSGDGSGGEELRMVGLSMEIVERMKWEQERVGWVSGDSEGRVRVERREEFEGSTGWTKFGCYVLVERFVLKRMDSSVVLTYDFRHTHQIRCKWDH